MNRSSIRTQVEPCEPRRLMANPSPFNPAGRPTALLGADGTLRVVGTTRAERLEVRQRVDAIPRDASVERRNARIDVTVTSADGRRRQRVGDFDGAQVKQIDVRAGSGKDSVVVFLNAAINTTIDGGGGNDDLRASLGRASINGGAGDDTITANTAIAGRVDAETKVFRGLFNATYNRLDGGAGDDTIQSVGGEDVVIGGTGQDTFTPLGDVTIVRDQSLPRLLLTSDVADVASRASVLGVEVVNDRPTPSDPSALPTTARVRVASLRARSLASAIME